jgi:KipI family sensor histidine kinase inhibitor
MVVSRDAKRGLPEDVVLLRPEFHDCGESALQVDFGSSVNKELSLAILNLSEHLDEVALPGMRESIPAFSTLTIFYDPLVLPKEELMRHVELSCQSARAGGASGRLWTIPVLYGAAVAPDLPEVAAQTGLTQEDVCELHSAQTYHVYMLGFLPGFAYLGDLPKELQLRRRQTPRARVPPGSVAIAAEFTAIYPLESPGGWHLIGYTPIPLWDMTRMKEPLLRPGDSVRFRSIGENEAAELKERLATGWLPASEAI